MALASAADLIQGHTVTNRGAPEHSVDGCDWVAFANIGLPEAALVGSKHSVHAADLTTQTKGLLEQNHCLGICFCEAGNLRQGYTGEAARVFEEAIRSGFERAGATEHGAPQFLWPTESEELVAVFRAEVVVEQQELRRNLCRNQKDRAAQILDLVYCNGRGRRVGKVRLINSHQPASKERKFPPQTRIELVKSLIRIGIPTEDVIGSVIGGDLNCHTDTIWTALEEDTVWKVTTRDPPQLVYANNRAANNVNERRHHGDVAIGMNLEMMQTDCNVQNRDPQHECVVAGWVRPTVQARLRKDRRIACKAASCLRTSSHGSPQSNADAAEYDDSQAEESRLNRQIATGSRRDGASKSDSRSSTPGGNGACEDCGSRGGEQLAHQDKAASASGEGPSSHGSPQSNADAAEYGDSKTEVSRLHRQIATGSSRDGASKSESRSSTPGGNGACEDCGSRDGERLAHQNKAATASEKGTSSHGSQQSNTGATEHGDSRAEESRSHQQTAAGSNREGASINVPISSTSTVGGASRHRDAQAGEARWTRTTDARIDALMRTTAARGETAQVEVSEPENEPEDEAPPNRAEPTSRCLPPIDLQEDAPCPIDSAEGTNWQTVHVLYLMADTGRTMSARLDATSWADARPPLFALSEEQDRALRNFVEAALLRKPDPRGTIDGSQHDQEVLPPGYVQPARRLQEPSAVFHIMDSIMDIRRRITSDDRAVLNEKAVTECWNSMMKGWCASNLSDEQSARPASKKSSIFGAFVNRTYGSKHFVMAIWECGLSWMPDIGATEHDAGTPIMNSFCAWLARVLAALDRRSNDRATQVARRKSGMWGPRDQRCWRSGLDAEERDDREQRDNAKLDLLTARALEYECADALLYERGEWPIWKGRENDRLQWWNKRRRPREQWRMRAWEQTLLERLRSGELYEDVHRTRLRHGGLVAAPPFRVATGQ